MVLNKMSVKEAFRHLYAPEYMIKPEEWVGSKYNTKEVYRRLYNVAWPATVETLLISMISFIDTMMVSSVGSYAIAATGLTNQPRLIFFAVFFALNVGVTAIVSRRKGEYDRDGANKCLAQGIFICIALSVVLCAAAIALARPLLIFAGAMEDTIEPATTYFRITMVGMVFSVLGLVINAAQRGAGNTKISMKTNLTANIVNVIFNYLLINGIGFFPELGVTGAGIATLLGNMTGCAMSIYSVSHKDEFLYLRIKDIFRLDKETLRLIAKIGGSAAVEQVFVRIGFFAYAKMVATLGTVALATHQICMSIINLSFSFGDGLGIAGSALVGQNLGRKRPDMATIYGKSGQRVGLLVSFLLMILFSSCGRGLMGLFSSEEHIVELGIKILVIVAFTSPAQISQVIFAGCLRGSGDTKYVAITSLVSIAILRPLITYLLCYTAGMGLIGAWISLLVDQYVRLAFSAFRFTRGKWTKIEL